MTEARGSGPVTHVARTGTFRLPMAPAAAFPYFSPEGERAWAPGWAPEYLHPADGTPAPGLVFRTRAGGEETLWLLLRYDMAALETEYVRVVPGSRMGTVSVRCVPAGGSAPAADVHVTYRLTALSEAGRRTLERLTPAAYAAMLEEWRAAITRLLPPA
jgi:hypothetical protein